jgi:hypothetical protein
LEYFKVTGFCPKHPLKKFTAVQLRDIILRKEGFEPINSIDPQLELDLTAPDAQLTLTHVPAEETEFIVERVLDHRTRKGKSRVAFEYLVKWEGYDEKENSWVKQSKFARDAFTLGDYWIQKVDEENGVIEGGGLKRIKHSGDDASENGDDSYIVSAIEGHERVDGIMFYEVLWGGKLQQRSTVSEHNFDDDVMLTEYWRKRYYDLKK